MNVELPRDTRLTHTWPRPGEWAFVRKGPTAYVACPRCGQSTSLSDHSINALGVVSPALLCPTDGCLWSVYAILAGWVAAVAENATR